MIDTLFTKLMETWCLGGQPKYRWFSQDYLNVLRWQTRSFICSKMTGGMTRAWSSTTRIVSLGSRKTIWPSPKRYVNSHDTSKSVPWTACIWSWRRTKCHSQLTSALLIGKWMGNGSENRFRRSLPGPTANSRHEVCLEKCGRNATMSSCRTQPRRFNKNTCLLQLFSSMGYVVYSYLSSTSWVWIYLA